MRSGSALRARRSARSAHRCVTQHTQHLYSTNTTQTYNTQKHIHPYTHTHIHIHVHTHPHAHARTHTHTTINRRHAQPTHHTHDKHIPRSCTLVASESCPRPSQSAFPPCPSWTVGSGPAPKTWPRSSSPRRCPCFRAPARCCFPQKARVYGMRASVTRVPL